MDDTPTDSFRQLELLTIHEVTGLVKLSRASIYRLAKAGRFPRPLQVGIQASRWRRSEIVDWIVGLTAARGTK